MSVERKLYVNRIVAQIDKPAIKVITGIRRCGKSYLLFELFYAALLSRGISREQIICINLEDEENENLREPQELYQFILAKMPAKNRKYYILLDEVQYAIRKEDLQNTDAPLPLYSVLNGLLQKKNADIYVTGSNSKFLSRDVMTEFRGRGEEIYVQPLSFSEYAGAYDGTLQDAWEDYLRFGGMPYLFQEPDEESKVRYLQNLYDEIYLKDMKERYELKNAAGMETLTKVIASDIGSLTNPKRISDTFKSSGEKGISEPTIAEYISYLQDCYMVNKAERYDIKGRKHIGTPSKYYFSDVGLRNAMLNFRQMERTHLMENVIYNELLYRGFRVDVGVVPANVVLDGKKTRRQYEVDFVAEKGSKRYYLQSAYRLETREKREQEERGFSYIRDSFQKIIVTDGNEKPWHTDAGTLVLGVLPFLLDEESWEM